MRMRRGGDEDYDEEIIEEEGEEEDDEEIETPKEAHNEPEKLKSLKVDA